jgi:bla regulator protein blaR1
MTNHLWQSTLFAIAAALLALALRHTRAQVRYWIWLCASLKFLIPFAVLLSLGSQFHWTSAKKMSPPSAVSRTVVDISEPFTVISARSAHRRDWLPPVLFTLWACGFASVALLRFRDWRNLRAAVCASRPTEILAPIEIRRVEGPLEPGIYGLFQPILLLPADIEERLAPAELEAVLAHELCHVRRRDNLTSAIHMLVEAAFWFHPLVWWIGAHLIEERERACDEDVLRQGNQPQVYAEAILNVCKSYVESRLVCAAGVSGSDLKKRIHAILSGAIGGNLTFAKKAALAMAAVAAVSLPVFVGALRAQTAVPKFEVASVRACEGNAGGGRNGDGRGKSDRGGGGGNFSPDRLTMNCLPIVALIRTSYIIFADGHVRGVADRPVEIEGLPQWAESLRYTINATSEAKPGQEMMRGPMLQALLEERFQLKIRRESREVPVYALSAAKGGLKISRVAEDACIQFVPTFPPTPPPPLGGKPMCGGGSFTLNAGNQVIEFKAATLDEIASTLEIATDRPVVDRSGIPGRFALRLEFAPMEGVRPFGGGHTAPPASGSLDQPTAPSIFTALQELGLKLEPAKGPRDFLVIEHLEKPSEN